MQRVNQLHRLWHRAVFDHREVYLEDPPLRAQCHNPKTPSDHLATVATLPSQVLYKSTAAIPLQPTCLCQARLHQESLLLSRSDHRATPVLQADFDLRMNTCSSAHHSQQIQAKTPAHLRQVSYMQQQGSPCRRELLSTPVRPCEQLRADENLRGSEKIASDI